MSQQNEPAPAPTPTVVRPPNPEPKQPLEHNLVPPPMDIEQYNAVVSRARHDIALIEHQAREKARFHFPIEPLPRAMSNIRSVKRTRFARKEVERVLSAKILEKVARNRELDRLIEIEIERNRQITKQIREVEKLPDIDPDLEPDHEPDHEPDLARVEHETPEQVMQEFLAQFDAEDAETPNTAEQPLERPDPESDFEAQYGDLTSNFLDFQPFADTNDGENAVLPECEPTIDPKCLLDVPSDLPGELEYNFLVSDDEPHQEPENEENETEEPGNEEPENEEPENEEPENEERENQEPDSEELENPAHQDVF